MKNTEIIFDASEKMLHGAWKTSKAVASTLGPGGRTVIIYIDDRMHTTKDGVTVADFIQLDDTVENAGSVYVREAARRTVRDGGDGTTTACILTYAIMKAGLKAIKSGANPVVVVKGIREASTAVLEELQQIAQPINGDYDLIENVATISANNDNELGKLIRQAMEQVGVGGIIKAAESDLPGVQLKITDGMEYPQGYSSPMYVNNPHKASCELGSVGAPCAVIVSEEDLTTYKQVKVMLEYFARNRKPFIIVAKSMVGEARSLFDANIKEGKLNGCFVEAVGAGDRQLAYLEDLAIFTNGELWGPSTGLAIESFDPEKCGSCASVTIEFRETLFVVDKINKKAVEKRIETVSALRAKTRDEFAVTKYSERIQRLKGKAAVITVGAPTPQELGAKKDQLDDAIKATQASTEMGVVPGGGISFLKCLPALEKMSSSEHVDKDSAADFYTGVKCVTEAMRSVFDKIITNAGGDPNVVFAEILAKKMSKGYNAKTGKIVDMFKDGIINPMKVDGSALANAVSASTMMLLTDAIVHAKEE